MLSFQSAKLVTHHLQSHLHGPPRSSPTKAHLKAQSTTTTTRRSLLFLSGAPFLLQQPSSATADPILDTTITGRVFLDFFRAQGQENPNPNSDDAPPPFTDSEPVGRVVLGLYGKLVPIRVSNFKAMCTGSGGSWYKKTLVHKVLPGQFMVADSGNLTRNTETVESRAFMVWLCLGENDDIKFNPDYHNVEFLITTGPAPCPQLQLDGNNIVFGTLLEGGSGENVLAKHVAFFDRNHDGVVYPSETFQGFRAIGAGLLLSSVAAVVINMGLSGKTRPGSKFPNLLFPIEIKNIAKAKHGSDSGVYDTEGRFVPSKFEEIFSKHARTNSNALTSEELSEMLKANRQPKDFAGRFGSYIEWKVLFFLCKDKDGYLQRDTIRGVYDGSLFEKMEKEKQSAKKKP